MNIHVDATCPRCNTVEEDLKHVFLCDCAPDEEGKVMTIESFKMVMDEKSLCFNTKMVLSSTVEQPDPTPIHRSTKIVCEHCYRQFGSYAQANEHERRFCPRNPESETIVDKFHLSSVYREIRPPSAAAGATLSEEG